MPDDRWLSATEAIARLGVKPQTLYAYVSRGLIRRERPAGSRTSRYRAPRRRAPRRARSGATGPARSRDRRRPGDHRPRPRRPPRLPGLGCHPGRGRRPLRAGRGLAVGHHLRPERPLDRRPCGCRDRPGGASRAPGGDAPPGPAARRRRRAPRRRPLARRPARRGRGRTRRHTPGHPRRGTATGRPARHAVVDRLTGATTLDTRVAPRTDDPSRAGARPRALVARRPRARDVDAGGARGRLGLGGSLPAAPHRPRDRGRTAPRRGVGVRPRASPRRGGHRRRDGRRTRHARRRSGCPGSVTRSTRVPIRGRRCSSTRSRRAGRPATSGAPPQVCST